MGRNSTKRTEESVGAMKKQIVWYVAGVLIAAAVTWLVVAPTETDKKKDAPSKEEGQRRKKSFAEAKAERAKARLAKKQGLKRAVKEKRENVIEENEEFTPDEQQLADKIESAVDEDKFKALQAEIEAAANSTNAALRQAAVDALSWFGVKALPELTLFMADVNDDVRNAACDAWTASISEIQDVNVRGSAVLSAMSVVHDRDQLDAMVMEINDMTNQQQLEILTQLIEGKNKLAAEAAKEHYEFVTGEAYESVEAAQKWLDENPDEESDPSTDNE